MSPNCAKVNNILLVAITRLGDLLQASPTIVGLKRQHPGARITVLVDTSFSQICYGIPGIDEVREIDLAMLVRCMGRERESLIDAYRYVDSLVKELKARNFDFCLNISSSAYTAVLLRLLRVKDSQGWLSDEEGFRIISNPWSVLFAAFIYHSNRDYNSLNLVDIVRCSARVTEHPRRLMYNVPESATTFADEFLKSVGLATGNGPLICVQIGASQEKRQWSVEKFARLNQLLIENLGSRIVLTGTAKELPLVDAVLRSFPHPQIKSVAGRTDLGQLAAILQRADLLITGDTGPMHLAVAVSTPVIAIFLASALYYETGPYSEGNFVLQPQISCNPCNPNYPCSRPDCHEQISPELVSYLAKLRLETRPGAEMELKISSSIADPSQVAVLCSMFDDDNFLDFVQLNRGANQVASKQELARRAYRQLWKDEFGATSKCSSALPDSDAQPVNGYSKDPQLTGQRTLTALPIVNGALDGLEEAVQLSREGIRLIEELVQLIRDPGSPAAQLGVVNRALEKIDKSLEELGLTHPILGALTRVFVLEKSNMRGQDPLLLASEMRGLYEVLHRRTEKFEKLLMR